MPEQPCKHESGLDPTRQVAAHEADVNVISWNRLAAFMLASGGDDGALRVWDLRNFAAGEHVASFAYHRSGARPPHTGGAVMQPWSGAASFNIA